MEKKKTFANLCGILNRKAFCFCYSNYAQAINKRHKQEVDLNTKGFQKTLPKEYTLIGEYIDGETKVLIKHECGFIWKVKPHFLRRYEGCPKCNRKISKGERRIINYLQEKQIAFEP